MEKNIQNTNIKVRYEADISASDPVRLLKSLKASDATELAWSMAQRPLQNMIHPAEAFNQGIKTLKPAVMFNTYDAVAAKSRRLQRQSLQKKRTAAYRAANVTPSVGIKALGDRKKINVQAVDEFEEDPVLRQMPKKEKKARRDPNMPVDDARRKKRIRRGKVVGKFIGQKL